MKAVIDTCSLVSLMRYYLPFDKEGKLKNFIKEQISCKNILVLDEVKNECHYQSKGQVLEALLFLRDAKYLTKTSSLSANSKFHELIENNFVYGRERNKLDAAEFQSAKDAFTKSADLLLVLYAYNNKKVDDVIVITEETSFENDGKAFKKIPELCRIANVTAMTLPEFFKQFTIINLSIDITATTLF